MPSKIFVLDAPPAQEIIKRPMAVGSTGIAPLRGSLRAAPITFRCGWAGVPLSADEVIAKQLAKAAFGWMGTARHLVGPSLCSFLHRWSSRILRIAVPFLAHPLDVIQSLDMYFSSCMRRTDNVPSLLIGIKSRLFTTSFEKFFNFFQNSSFALADSLLSDMHNF